ncbi:EscU/YscU/HrcU family type III secretion system export apparatus switch protein [Pilimelia columellifera]|uniref:Flagellar biosynthesis protein FlhB n=1 Tax=Pilimelia columellifera subsp. columellifera TaxID=706583 RepID=A0ABN3N7R4_9ACTN
MAGEKTEEPTPQKLKKARQEGQIGKTPDLGAWIGMLAASILVPMTMEKGLEKATEIFTKIPAVIENPTLTVTGTLMKEALLAVAVAVGPLAAALMVLGVGGFAAQGGIRVASKLFMPKFSRLNPWKGAKQKFGPQAWWEGAKALIKTIVLGIVLYYTVKDLLPLLMYSGSLPLASLLGTITKAIVTLIQSAAVAGLVMAAADFFVVKKRTNKQLRMTKQEVKDEHKKSDGDPQLKGQIRSRQLAMARNRMMSDLAKADVVLVNPTHVAVALRYDPENGAPKLLAKGAGNIATKIREKAAEHRIPMVQDVPLARALHANCEIGQEIPPQFYGAVAKVLAFVMSLKAKGSAAGTHKAPTPSNIDPALVPA